jgi:hypothetical protein
MIPELSTVQLTYHGAPITRLPRFSGVYRFYDDDDALLYVGKSIDIHHRILAHFTEGRKPGRHQRLMQSVKRIDCQGTAGEIGALLLENAAIKAETPLFNRRQRQLRTLYSLRLEAHSSGFLQPRVVDFAMSGERQIDAYGLFSNPKHADNTLRRHARDQGLCLRMLGLDKGKGPCFQYQIKRCDGACAGQETPEEHNARLLSVLDNERIAAWPFAGAVVLVERTIKPLPDQPEQQWHAVSHWAYLGSFICRDALESALATRQDHRFDRDAYRILYSALRKGRIDIADPKTLKPVHNPFARNRELT